MKRRAVLAFGAGLLPAATAAQQAGPLPPLIGVVRVNGKSVEQFEPAFRRDMTRLGWEDGRNVRFGFLWADGQTERLPDLAGELVARKADILVAFGKLGVEATQRATRQTPIVGMADDLVGEGLVASIARPGGNITGVSILGHELDVKRLELLHELAPRTRKVGVIVDPGMGGHDDNAALRKAAIGLGLEPVFVSAENRDQLARAFDGLSAEKVEAVNVLASPFLNAVRGLIIERMREMRLPVIYEWPETAEEGGLMGYGPRITLCYRHVAVLVDRLLHGAKPSDLPIERPTVFTLVVNAGTAHALGLPIPPVILLRADTVVD